jgi:hypothetical protein
MATMYDYLTWRGDLTFSHAPVNEVDSLIFSTLTYAEYELIVPDTTGPFPLTLSELAEPYAACMEKQKEKIESLGFFAEIHHLLEQVAQTERFGSIPLQLYETKLNAEESIQFAAMVFTVKKNLHFVAFRGTDTNLVGWKEDLQMSFMEEIAAQHAAADYFERICGELSGNFILGGHSKGGNLAVYAAVKASAKNRKRIKAVYNNDGPGFQSKVVESSPYQSMVKKISTFIPQSSIVGILLEHGGDYTAVESSQVSILQHDPFSWEIEGPHFSEAEELGKGVLALKQAIRTWLNKVSIKEREEFVKGFCELVDATGAETLEDLTSDKLQSAYAILKAYTHMSKETRLQLKKTMDLLFKESRKSFRETIREEIEQLFPKKRSEEIASE